MYYVSQKCPVTLRPASYDMSLTALSTRQLLRHTTKARAIQYLKGGLSEEPLKSMPISHEK